MDLPTAWSTDAGSGYTATARSDYGLVHFGDTDISGWVLTGWVLHRGFATAQNDIVQLCAHTVFELILWYQRVKKHLPTEAVPEA